jgi:hypothetical protein
VAQYWASNNVTNILMEADTFQFMQPKHFAALEEEGEPYTT